MKDRRAIIFLVVLLIVMVGGALVIRSGGDSSSTGTGGSDGSTTTTATGASATSTSTSIPQATQENFDTAVRRVSDAENELFSHPDASRVGEIMDSSCGCYADAQKRLTNLSSKGWRVSGPNITVLKTSAYETTPTTVEGVVNVSTGTYKVVDASGKAVEAAPNPSTQPLVYVMKKGQDGVWRIFDRHLPEEVH